MFNEDNTTEKMVVDTLRGHGWKYVPAEELPREHSDVLVETMVKDALVRLNPEIEERPDRADEVIYRLRAITQTASATNLITSNERFKKLVFEENTFPFGEDGKMVSVRFFGTAEDGGLGENEYVITNQWVYPKDKGGKRLDIVLLVNGFPVVIGELKSPVRSESWLDGANDVAGYEKSIPGMFSTNVLCFATEGSLFRYGCIGMPPAKWGPWHVDGDRAEGTIADVRRSVLSMLTPENVMEFLEYYTLFSSDKRHRRCKIVARYQQFEAANMIVDRVRAGWPKKGLIWHFQGSGKSLLMVFAAQKLRMTPELKNPTVVIVDDRINLEDQITGDFNAADVPNMASAGSKEELASFFTADARKILITTIFKFGEVGGVLNERDNIIVMVDEAHRTQEGDLGEKMRTALPNAFFFGLTGTPINRTDKNTFRAFGAAEDKSGYMARYSYGDAVRDGETLPLHFEAVPVELHIDRDAIDSALDDLTEGLPDSDKAELSKRVKLKALMEAPDRVHAVCEHIAHHFNTKVAPAGLKGMVVCFDRDGCLLAKAELDNLMGADASTVVIDTNDDKAGKYKAWHRERDAEEKVLDRFRNPDDPLQLLIVTAKLLTGFDAPILQAMYLDKPMKDHTLLQAVCRTNRVYNDEKSFGLVVDYLGVFDNVAKALDFDDTEVKTIVTNIDDVRDKVPVLIGKCLSYFIDVEVRSGDVDYQALEKAQECLPTADVRDAFAADFRVLSRVWEALSPDPCLSVYRSEYVWLSQVYQSVRPVDQRGALIWASLGPKTIAMIHEHITVEHVGYDAEILELDPDLIEKYLKNSHETPGGEAKKIEIDLVARIRRHDKEQKFIKLGERLESLRRRQEEGLITTINYLKALIELAREARAAEVEVVPEDEEDKGRAALTELFEGIRTESTPIIVSNIVNDIDEIVRVARFDGWQNTTAGIKEIKSQLRKILWIRYKLHDDDLFEKAYSYIEMYY
ncbi:MAG: HsdR family type I site-specific deoxyribonuclease [Atopobiaceae bacterium]